MGQARRYCATSCTAAGPARRSAPTRDRRGPACRRQRWRRRWSPARGPRRRHRRAAAGSRPARCPRPTATVPDRRPLSGFHVRSVRAVARRPSRNASHAAAARIGTPAWRHAARVPSSSTSAARTRAGSPTKPSAWNCAAQGRRIGRGGVGDQGRRRPRPPARPTGLRARRTRGPSPRRRSASAAGSSRPACRPRWRIAAAGRCR